MPDGPDDIQAGGDRGNHRAATQHLIRGLNADASCCSDGAPSSILRAWLTEGKKGEFQEEGAWGPLCKFALLMEPDAMMEVMWRSFSFSFAGSE